MSGGRRCVLGKDTLYEFPRPIGDGRKARRSRVHEFHVHVKAHLTGRFRGVREIVSHVVVCACQLKTASRAASFMTCPRPQCCCCLYVSLSGNRFIVKRFELGCTEGKRYINAIFTLLLSSAIKFI